MLSTDVAIIGAGQAGLAVSRCLSDRAIDHLVFERDEIGSRWKTHAWDSLRLLTPNWMNALPGSPYRGAEPDGFMPCSDFAASLPAYAASFAAPVLTRTMVESMAAHCGGFRIATNRGTWRARCVVVATGQCDQPLVPAIARATERVATNIHSSEYRCPAALPDGAVLVVGASASGVQIADELRAAGREVVVSVGRHTRLPRTWRGRDIFWWLDRMGVLAERTRDIADPAAAMRQPSLQLAGRPDRASVDLAALQSRGVRLAGRLVAAEGGSVAFAPDLPVNVIAAEAKMHRLLERIDTFAGVGESGCGSARMPVLLPQSTPRRLSLAAENIRSVVWATGYRRSFPWLIAPVLGSDGELVHREGVTPVPGLFALGYRLLRKRDSNFIGGVGTDAAVLAGQISSFLGQRGEEAA